MPADTRAFVSVGRQGVCCNLIASVRNLDAGTESHDKNSETTMTQDSIDESFRRKLRREMERWRADGLSVGGAAGADSWKRTGTLRKSSGRPDPAG